MTLQECYNRLNGSYKDALARLMNERIMDKFILKFPQDDSIYKLREGLQTGDLDEAFMAAHTMKGVAGNLGFTGLMDSVSELTEVLRRRDREPDDKLVQKVENDYAVVISVLSIYAREKQ